MTYGTVRATRVRRTSLVGRRVEVPPALPAPVRAVPVRAVPSVKEEYAKLVASKLDGPVLRYSERVRMIREGMKRGIGRFECNLIIAMEEHRAGKVLVPEKTSGGWGFGWVAFAVVQGAIVAGVWWVVG